MFYVGQKVVCVNDDWTPGFSSAGSGTLNPKRLPIKGEIYTIVGFAPADMYGPEQLWLLEFPETYGTSDPISFNELRFRPLTDTSISDVLARKAPTDSRQWDNRRKVKERA